jgi:hypothetical protein
MGAWGYNWKQCDDAHDMVAEVLQPMRKAWANVIMTKSRASRSRWYDRARSAAVIASNMPNVVGDDDLESAEKALQNILDDKKYVDSWDDPDQFRSCVESNLESVRKARSDRCSKTT